MTTMLRTVLGPKQTHGNVMQAPPPMHSCAGGMFGAGSSSRVLNGRGGGPSPGERRQESAAPFGQVNLSDSISKPGPIAQRPFINQSAHHHGPVTPPTCSMSQLSLHQSMQSVQTTHKENSASASGSVIFSKSTVHERVLPEGSIGAGKGGQRDKIKAVYSKKVFIGGLPPDITCDSLAHQFEMCGERPEIDWPHRANAQVPPLGYAFLVFGQSSSVERLLGLSTFDQLEHKWRIRVKSATQDVMAQVRAFRLSDAAFTMRPQIQAKPQPEYHIFIGGLPRNCRALDIAQQFEAYWGGVLSVQVVLHEEHSYPKGSARITLNNKHSFVAALHDRFLSVVDEDAMGSAATGTETKYKEAEMKPFFDCEAKCCQCKQRCDHIKLCVSMDCCTYYCAACRDKWHLGMDKADHHYVDKMAKFPNHGNGRTVSVSSEEQNKSLSPSNTHRPYDRRVPTVRK